MKRQELKNLLRGIKPDGDISDIVDQIMELNGADIENAKKNAGTDYEAVVADRDKWKAEAESYAKGGANYVDPAEIERLKKFETDTKAAQKRSAVEAAVNEMLTKNKVLPGYIKLMLKNLNADEVQLDDKGKVTAEYEKKYIADFKAECPEGFAQPNDGTGAPAHGGNGSNEGGGATPKATLESVLKEWHDNKK